LQPTLPYLHPVPCNVAASLPATLQAILQQQWSLLLVLGPTGLFHIIKS
jgi:hypothetical protein